MSILDPEITIVSARRKLLVLLGGAVVALALILIPAASARAESQEAFCTNFHAGAVGGGSARCHDPNLRLVTQVLVEAGAHSACASALNSGGTLLYGWICAGPGEFTINPEPDGTQWEYGVITNNAAGENIISGREWFL